MTTLEKQKIAEAEKAIGQFETLYRDAIQAFKYADSLQADFDRTNAPELVEPLRLAKARYNEFYDKVFQTHGELFHILP